MSHLLLAPGETIFFFFFLVFGSRRIFYDGNESGGVCLSPKPHNCPGGGCI